MRLWTIALLWNVLPTLWAQSLMTASTLADGTLYADQAARAVGDLITVLVRESSEIDESHATETGRSNSGSFGGSLTLPKGTDTSTTTEAPALTINSSNSFQGDGSYKNSGKVSTALTGRVVDVLDNGNLVIEARRNLQFNQDTKTIVVSGIIRRADIGANNTVLSEKIHNFQVSIVGEGPLSRTQQRGWLARLFDVLWPL